jgi:hypothetical protein
MYKLLFLILDFQPIISNYKFKEITACEVENGVLGLERDVYLSIVKFLDSSLLRKVSTNIFLSF